MLSFVLESETPHSNPCCTTGSRREARTEAILRAALEELAEAGYSAFSIEAVASRVGIAKTTVYRRYPTKAELVRAALRQFVNDAIGEPPNTGSLRGDLIALGRRAVDLASSVLGQGIFRTRLLDRTAPELDEMGREFDCEHEALHRAVAERAVSRGELSNESDFDCMVQILSGALLFKLVIKKHQVDELEITRIVDMLLGGVAKPSTRSRHGL
jgi:AcrR family transcriptional regulator